MWDEVCIGPGCVLFSELQPAAEPKRKPRSRNGPKNVGEATQERKNPTHLPRRGFTLDVVVVLLRRWLCVSGGAVKGGNDVSRTNCSLSRSIS